MIDVGRTHSSLNCILIRTRRLSLKLLEGRLVFASLCVSNYFCPPDLCKGKGGMFV